MKQAVVLIHGIGEQKPMDTVRSFVESVLPPAAEGMEQYWSKPNPMSESFELRRLQAVGRNKIHFFEYYWAYQIEGTTFHHLAQWLLQLLFRRPRNVPKGLRTIWWLSWVLLISACVVTAGGLLGKVLPLFENLPPYGPMALLLFALLGLLQGFLIYYAGDAARYLSPSPQNIALRQRIRAEGAALVQRLHESGEYDRIVIVGHSLGSVIGYDILTALWQKHNDVYDFKSRESELDALLANNSRPQPVLRDAIASIGEVLRRIPVADSTRGLRSSLQHAYRAAQLACWKEQCLWGNTWRVTDFITLGSPLTHAMMLLARNNEEFAARKRQRELPTCPPVPDGKRYAYTPEQRTATAGGRQFSPLVLHHAACFAVTHWTNLYFPAYLGLFGDAVGGPLADVFGPGISDVPVRSRGIRRFTLAAHTAYWYPRSAAASDADPAEIDSYALPALKQALRIDHPREFVVPPSAVDDSSRAALVELNKKIDDMQQSGGTTCELFAEMLSERFLFHCADGPVLGKKDMKLILESLKLPPTAMSRTKNISVTPIGRQVLVTLVGVGTHADHTEEHFRHLRLFSPHDYLWKLETWYIYKLA